MSYDIALTTDTHDLAIAANGDLQLLDDITRVAQQVKVTLLTFLGEWFLDTAFGVPYLESILVKNPKISVVNALLRQRINDVPGVTRLVRLDLDFSRVNRRLNVSFEADTPYGLTGPHNVTLSIRGL